MSDPLEAEPPPTPATREGWLDKESFGFGLVGGVLASGILSLMAETIFNAAPISRAVGTVAIAMGLTVWFWRKRSRGSRQGR